MKVFSFLCLALLCYQSSAAGYKDSAMDKEFSSIEKELEKITEDETKKELESEILKLDTTTDKNAKKEVDLPDLAKDIKKNDEKVSSGDFDKLHKIMTKFDIGEINKGDLLSSLEDYFKKESLTLSRDVAEEDGMGCKDKRQDCAKLTQYCSSAAHKSSMQKKCAKTCKFCGDCINTISTKKCNVFLKNGFCDSNKFGKRMKNLCFKTCGYCSTTFVPKCAKTKFGCCWDKEMSRTDAAGSNCKACVDMYQNACKTFKDDCMKNNRAGKFMRNRCSDTCQLCKKCYDEPQSAPKCPYWKSIGWCKNMKTTMNVLCKRTCNFC